MGHGGDAGSRAVHVSAVGPPRRPTCSSASSVDRSVVRLPGSQAAAARASATAMLSSGAERAWRSTPTSAVHLRAGVVWLSAAGHTSAAGEAVPASRQSSRVRTAQPPSPGVRDEADRLGSVRSSALLLGGSCCCGAAVAARPRPAAAACGRGLEEAQQEAGGFGAHVVMTRHEGGKDAAGAARGPNDLQEGRRAGA